MLTKPTREVVMTNYRKWYCSCRGKPLELSTVETLEDEPVEAICQRCGASPSSDPKHTISY
ncbi:MAG: hypothetical protein OET55_10180, partial [Desulfuromonadales bacterium]|nr:hypothetical protein [Desulfuromonadales bacterium]